MKVLHNNQLNSILFVNNNESLVGELFAEFTQLGSDKKTSLPISVNFTDCYTVLFNVTLGENNLQNATHLLRVLNADGEPLFTTTVHVVGNTETNRGYIVLEDN